MEVNWTKSHRRIARLIRKRSDALGSIYQHTALHYDNYQKRIDTILNVMIYITGASGIVTLTPIIISVISEVYSNVQLVGSIIALLISLVNIAVGIAHTVHNNSAPGKKAIEYHKISTAYYEEARICRSAISRPDIHRQIFADFFEERHRRDLDIRGNDEPIDKAYDKYMRMKGSKALPMASLTGSISDIEGISSLLDGNERKMMQSITSNYEISSRK